MSAYEVAVKQAILNHYLSQRGSGAVSYPVFRGSQVQYGNGIGDIFKSIGRFLLPIFASSAKNFVTSAAQGITEGHSMKEAARRAIAPTIGATVSDAAEKLWTKKTGRDSSRIHTWGPGDSSRMQTLANGVSSERNTWGQGKVKVRRKGKKKRRSTAQAKVVYKRASRKRKPARKSSRKKTKTFLATNF